MTVFCRECRYWRPPGNCLRRAPVASTLPGPDYGGAVFPVIPAEGWCGEGEEGVRPEAPGTVECPTCHAEAPAGESCGQCGGKLP